MFEKYHDVSLPRPLLQPSARGFEGSTRSSIAVLSLDLAMEMGGPYRRYCEGFSGASAFAWRVRANFWSNDAIRLAAFRAEALRLLTWGQPVAWILDGEPSPDFTQLLGEWGPDTFVDGKFVAASSLEDWSRELFPETTRLIGELKLRGWLDRYEAEMPEAREFPWGGLRYFAGFVRRSGELDTSESLAVEWARAQSLFSPQDEEHERLTLVSDEVMLNPTLHFIRHERASGVAGRRLLALYRSQGVVVTKTLTWQEAALADELAESSRSTKDRLLFDLEASYGAAPGGLEKIEPFRDTMDRLVRENVVLALPSSSFG